MSTVSFAPRAAGAALAGALMLGGCAAKAQAPMATAKPHHTAEGFRNPTAARSPSEALDQPPRDLAQARAAAGIDEAAFGVLAIGQTRWLPAREARQSPP